MSHSREGRYNSHSPSLSPHRGSRSRSLSKSRMRSRSRSREDEGAQNPGNNLYVTGLSTRVTRSVLEKYFSVEGKVQECDLVTDPRTRESRGFGFVTMENIEDADRCIKYLNHSVLEGRIITVEKAKRKCGRTATPGRYHGPKANRDHGRKRSPSYSPRRRQESGRSRSRDRRERSCSPYRMTDEQSSSHRRRRERSLSTGSDGNPKSY